QWFFTMELVRGKNFVEHVGRPCDEARLRAVLPQLVSALDAIHRAGHVHRDIKPSNVLVGHDGRLVLLDFGLIIAQHERAQSKDDVWMIGTPAFMAPEQAEGSVVGPAADWYGVGVMLFLALTGVMPFEGSATEILLAKRSREAPAPHDRAKNVPADLDALCIDLLRTDPSQRPTAEAIRARLGMPASDASSQSMEPPDRTP